MIRNTLTILAALTAGVAAAVTLTLPHDAKAWSITNLPAAFHVSHISGGSGCSPYYSIIYLAGDGTGAVSPDLCDNSPTFQQDLDAFVDSPCTAVGATCTPPPPPPPPPTTAASTTDASVTTTETTTATVTVTDPATTTAPTTNDDVLAKLSARVSALEQRQTVDEARLATIEQRLGIIVGESKNLAPFTAAR